MNFFMCKFAWPVLMWWWYARIQTRWRDSPMARSKVKQFSNSETRSEAILALRSNCVQLGFSQTRASRIGLRKIVGKRWNFPSFVLEKFRRSRNQISKRVSLCVNLLRQCYIVVVLCENAIQGNLLGSLLLGQCGQVPDWFCQRYMLSLKIKPCMSSSS